MIAQDPGFVLETPIDREEVLRRLERAGRTCYKSEDRVSGDSAARFVRSLVSRGHESVLEHVSLTVRVVCDRGVSHEIVRHRIASYSQESTRYCNYGTDRFDRQIRCIRPSFFREDTPSGLPRPDRDQGALMAEWERAMEQAEAAYLRLLDLGATPQEARAVLPHSLKTELVMTMNLREWRHFFRLRCAQASHPQLREVAIPMLLHFRDALPEIFDEIVAETGVG